jgi:hypothetical protein
VPAGTAWSIACAIWGATTAVCGLIAGFFVGRGKMARHRHRTDRGRTLADQLRSITMTTKVVIACPDSSVHNALIYAETRNDDGEWTRTADPIIVEPHGTAPSLYLTASQRIVIEEEPRNEDAKPKR